MAEMIEYRRDHAIDNDEYNQLRLRAWGREYGFDWAPVLARSLGWITARVHDHLIGFVNVAWDGGCHMFLLDTTVDPEFQRRGIGSELVRRALDMGAEAGGEWMHVDSDEILMRDFYGHCGFSPTPAGLAYLPALRTQGAALKTTRLEGGARWPVTREGDVVYKAAGPWTPAVHALLRHLEVAGFQGAPRLGARRTGGTHVHRGFDQSPVRLEPGGGGRGRSPCCGSCTTRSPDTPIRSPRCGAI